VGCGDDDGDAAVDGTTLYRVRVPVREIH